MAWTQLLNTKLSLSTFLTTGTVFSSVSLPALGTAIPGTGTQNSMIDAWVSPLYDSSRRRLVFPAGGGHGDWAGNQVLGYNLTSSWTLIKTASSAFSTGPTYTPKNLDGSAASKHTYDSNVYMESLDKYYCGGGIFWSPGGDSVPQTVFWFDPVALTWIEKATRPGGYSVATCWDPLNQVLYLRTAQAFYSYNPLVELSAPNAAAYTLLFSQSAANIEGSTLALDSINRRIYRIERRTSSNPTGGLKYIDLNNIAAKEKTLPTTGDVDIETGTGAVGIVAGYSPGLIYADNRLVGLGPSTTFSTAAGTGEWAVYTLTPPLQPSTGVTMAWLRDTSAPGSQPPENGNHGVWKRFTGPSTSGKYYVINRWDGNVWEYTPSWSPTGLILDQVVDLNIQVTSS